MFDSIFSNTSLSSVTQFFIMAIVAILSGILYAFILSFRAKSSVRFFIVNAILPFVVAAMITFVNGNIGVAVAIGGAFALVRFRSAPGSADEIAAVFITMAAGVAFGMGYLAYGAIILIATSLLYDGLTMLPIFKHKWISEEKLLRITIPESLDYNDVFLETFTHYTKMAEAVGVKTTGMGSMFRLSFRIKMKDPREEKEFIDELRTLNGNLEIQILPFEDKTNTL